VTLMVGEDFGDGEGYEEWGNVFMRP
jgi:hypothetical protein